MIGVYGEKLSPKHQAFLSGFSDDIVFDDTKCKVVLALGDSGKELFKEQHPDINLAYHHTTPKEMDGAAFWSEKLDSYVVCTYHPKHILNRNPKNGDRELADYVAMEQAVQQAEGLLEIPLLSTHDFQYTRVSDINLAAELMGRHLEAGGTWGLDVETHSVKDMTLLSLQYSNGDDISVSIDADAIPVNMLRHYLHDFGVHWVLHNATFDMEVLYKHFNAVPAVYDDTMVMAYTLNENLSQVGLKRLSRYMFNVDMYDFWKDQHLPKKNTTWDNIPMDVLSKYGALDTWLTAKLYPELANMMESEGVLDLYIRYLKPAIATFTQMRVEGMNIDVAALDTLDETVGELVELRSEALKALARDAGFKASDVGKGKPKSEDLNPGSWQQLTHLLYEVLGLPKHHKDAKTSSKDLEMLSEYKVAHMISDYKAAKKIESLFINSIRSNLTDAHKVHPNLNLCGTATGRRSASSPNVQQIPRKNMSTEDIGIAVKDLFVPDTGAVFFESDYDQLEVWLAYHYSGDKTLYTALKSGDFHRSTASELFGKRFEDVTDEERQKAKGTVFGILYGSTASGLAMRLQVSIKEAQKMIDRFFSTYPAVQEMQQGFAKDGLMQGYVETTTGRRRRFHCWDERSKYRVSNQAKNSPLQSLAGDLTLHSLVKVNSALRDKGLGKCFADVHDSIVGQIDAKRIQEGIDVIERIMTAPPFDTKMELSVETKIGESWGKVKEMQNEDNNT